VWAISPASGNERLVLLALADACSRDDGSGCWPSAAIARKASISDRTVRRVIARLETDGHVIVHRGGSRAGSTNSDTVVTGNRVFHSPGQNVTPDSLSWGDSDDTPPRTKLRQGTLDTAVSPDPPVNHKGTAAARVREARSSDRTAAGGGPEVEEFFDRLASLSPRWLLSTGQRGRLAPGAAAALAGRWTPGALADHIGADTAGIRNAGGVLAARLSSAGLPARRAPGRPPWCGECDRATRMVGFDGDAPSPCPRYKPGSQRARATAPETPLSGYASRGPSDAVTSPSARRG